MPDFNVTNPPNTITDPDWGKKNGTTKRSDEFPAHVHAEDGSYVVVADADAMAEKLKTGLYKKQPWTPAQKEEAQAARDKKDKK